MRIGSAPVNWLVAVALLGACAAGGLALYHYAGPEEVETPGPTSGGVADSRIEGQVHQFCGACHAYPSPDTFPKRYWRKEVEQGFRFFSRSGMDLSPPKVEAVVRYYEDRAPDELPAAPSPPAPGAPKLRFEKMPGRGAPNSDTNAIANVNLVRLPRPGEALSDETPLDVLACDMLNGRVMRLRPSDPASGWEVLARLSNPARTEVTDLDGDGILDILVADLGSFPPTNDYCGKVVWLRGAKDGTYEPITLLEKVGRVSDVRVADFRGAGRKDVLVGSFGWINSGELILLENHTEDWASPDFRPKVLDERHGVIHAPVADLNGDGRPDFVTVWAQEFESVEAFINKGDGEFERTVLYEGPHPGYGSSGIELADVPSPRFVALPDRPVEPSRLVEGRLHPAPCERKEADVVRGVADLPIGQGASIPIGERVPLGQSVTAEPVDELGERARPGHVEKGGADL